MKPTLHAAYKEGAVGRLTHNYLPKRPHLSILSVHLLCNPNNTMIVWDDSYSIGHKNAVKQMAGVTFATPQQRHIIR